MAEYRYQGSEHHNLVTVVNAQAALIDKLVADIAALDTALDALAAKLNADAANTALDDTDYAGAASAMTSDGESADTLGATSGS